MKLTVFNTSKDLLNQNTEYILNKQEFIKKGFKVIDFSQENKLNEEINLAYAFNKLIEKNPNILMSTSSDLIDKNLLLKIDYKTLEKTKASICGNGGLSPLLNGLVCKINNQTFYGPNFLNNFDFANANELYIDFVNTIINKNYTKSFKETAKNDKWIFFGKKNVKGILQGGDLNSLIFYLNDGFKIKANKKTILLIDNITDEDNLIKMGEFIRKHKTLKKVKTFLITEPKNKELNTKEIIQSYFNIKNKNFIFNIKGMNSKNITIFKLNTLTKINFKKEELIQYF